MIKQKLINLFKTGLLLSAFLTVNADLLSVDQAVTVTITPQANVTFNSFTLTNTNFTSNPDGSLTGTATNTWNYFNNERSSSKTYKVTGLISSHSSRTAPTGWTLNSTLGNPSDGTPFGKSTGSLSLPWSDQAAANFIGALPQTRAGAGSQNLGIIVSSLANFTSSQAFTISWTISAE